MKSKGLIIVLLIFLISCSSVALAQSPTITNMTASPNAFNSTNGGHTNITYILSDVSNGSVTLNITNTTSSTLVRTILVGNQSNGTHGIIWNGKDNSNVPVVEGFYTANVSVNLSGTIISAQTSVLVDNTPPVITITVPANGSRLVMNQVVRANWNASDALSGIASATGTFPNNSLINTASVGQKSFTVIAIDNASNKATKTVTYLVTTPNGIAVGNGSIISPIHTTSSNNKLTFNFNASKNNSGVGGFFNAHDNVNGMNLVGRVNSMSISVSGTVSTFSGIATVNGKPNFAFVVTVTDGGIGSKDILALSVPGKNYFAKGTLTSGNITITTSTN